MIPPGYEAQYLGQAGSVDELDNFKGIEWSQPEETRMILRLDFKWRFPLFEQAAGLANQAMKGLGVTPWPEYSDIIFYHPTEPWWYITWVKGFAWLAPILAALLSFFSTWAGQLLIAVFLGSLLWRVVPKEVKQPVGDILQMLPSLVVLALLAFMPQLVQGLVPGDRKQGVKS